MPVRHRLSNGLTVVFERLEGAPVAAFQVWVKAGSADEGPQQVGLAHLHEHMLFKGTERRGLGEIARTVEAHGGDINAWTSFDQTVYHVVMASRFARAGARRARRRRAPLGLRRRRAGAGDRGGVRGDQAQPRHALPPRLARPLRRRLTRHPYGRPVIGFEADVRAHTRERVLDFYSQYYAPSNLVLSAVGDFDGGGGAPVGRRALRRRLGPPAPAAGASRRARAQRAGGGGWSAPR